MPGLGKALTIAVVCGVLADLVSDLLWGNATANVVTFCVAAALGFLCLGLPVARRDVLRRMEHDPSYRDL